VTVLRTSLTIVRAGPERYALSPVSRSTERSDAIGVSTGQSLLADLIESTHLKQTVLAWARGHGLPRSHDCQEQTDETDY